MIHRYWVVEGYLGVVQPTRRVEGMTISRTVMPEHSNTSKWLRHEWISKWERRGRDVVESEGGTRTRSLYHVSGTMTVLVAWSLSLKCESHEGHESPFCLQRVTEGVAMGEGGHDCE